MRTCFKLACSASVCWSLCSQNIFLLDWQYLKKVTYYHRHLPLVTLSRSQEKKSESKKYMNAGLCWKDEGKMMMSVLMTMTSEKIKDSLLLSAMRRSVQINRES